MLNDKDVGQSWCSWEEFCGLRVDYLTALAATVEQGVKRRDTGHPAFCGCIDWHSSVHGVYALLAASRLTGDTRWADLVEGVLQPEKLGKELLAIQKRDLNHELPYGYSWFLQLAYERERWSGKMDLFLLASEVGEQLGQWIFSLSAEDIQRHALNRAYGNLSWAVLNLWRWSQLRQNVELIKRLSSFTRDRLLPLDQEFPHSYDDITDEFYPASLQRTRVILAILTPEEIQSWLASHYPDGLVLHPVQKPDSPHSAGLNFSRSWALWDLFRHTGNQVYRDLYVSHIVTHMEFPQYWRDDYQKYSHWVAQFGIYALALSLDNPT